MSTGPNSDSARSKRRTGVCAVGEIGFDRYGVAAMLANDVEHRLRISGAIVAIRVRNAGVNSVSESQVQISTRTPRVARLRATAAPIP